MYQRTKKYQKNDPAIENHYFSELPDLRRVIEIKDLDYGDPIKYKMELYRMDRIDCYDVFVNDQLWKKRIGWSKVLETLRKALLRQKQSSILLHFFKQTFNRQKRQTKSATNVTYSISDF